MMAEVSLDAANQRASAPRRCELTDSTVCYPRDARFIVAGAPKGDRGLITTGNPGMSDEGAKRGFPRGYKNIR
jgi:hypothetical protein